MPDLSFACESCRQALEAPAEMAGETVVCPSCQATIVIPTLPPPAAARANHCPSCGAALDTDAVLCIQCGYHLKLGKKLTTDFR